MAGPKVDQPGFDTERVAQSYESDGVPFFRLPFGCEANFGGSDPIRMDWVGSSNDGFAANTGAEHIEYRPTPSSGSLFPRQTLSDRSSGRSWVFSIIGIL